MIALLLQLAWGACPQAPTTTADVQRSIDAALFAFVDLDDAGFRAHRGEAIQAVICLGEVIHPTHAAAFLRLEGVYAFVEHNEPFAAVAFASARTVQPNYQLKAAVAPVGGPLHTIYASTATSTPAIWSLPPSQYPSFVNGFAATGAPAGLAIVQQVDHDGGLLWSGIVTGADGLPASFAGPPMPAVEPAEDIEPPPNVEPVVAAAPSPQPARPLPAPLPQPVKPAHPLDQPPSTALPPIQTPLWIAAGVVGAVGVGLYAGSALSRTQYDKTPTKAGREITNGLFFGAIGTGAVAVGLGLTGMAFPAKSATPKRASR